MWNMIKEKEEQIYKYKYYTFYFTQTKSQNYMISAKLSKPIASSENQW